jgi:glutathione S-transferase
MNDLVLHHYPASPFAEKIRLIFGLKKLAWKSVIIPMVMPKPDVIALTGGYRRTPLLQIGADIYCDTALIARVLEERAPEPPVFREAQAASSQALAQWGDTTLFNTVVPVLYQPGSAETLFAQFKPDELKRFMEDRAAMRKNSRVQRPPLAEARPALSVFLSQLDTQLGAGRGYLLGDAPDIADFAVYHPLWFFRKGPAVAARLAPYRHLNAWLARIDAIGHGSPSELSSAQAIDIARAAKAAPLASPGVVDADGFDPGDRVEVVPTDYAFDPVAGELLACTLDEIALRRTDLRAGEVAVHFPRLGYDIRRLA